MGFKSGLTWRAGRDLGERRTGGRYFDHSGDEDLSSGIGLGLTLGLIGPTSARRVNWNAESATLESMTTATATKIFADRIGRIGVLASMAITAAALKLKSEGVDLADFGAGEPHFSTPRHIKDAAIEAIEKNFTRYTNVAGIPEVRKAIVDRHATDFASNYTPEECVFTTGGKLALFNAIQVLVDHGDEVILPVPYWVSFKDFTQYAADKEVLPERYEA